MLGLHIKKSAHKSGAVTNNLVVVDDLDRTLEYWTSNLKAGQNVDCARILRNFPAKRKPWL